MLLNYNETEKFNIYPSYVMQTSYDIQRATILIKCKKKSCFLSWKNFDGKLCAMLMYDIVVAYTKREIE